MFRRRPTAAHGVRFDRVSSLCLLLAATYQLALLVQPVRFLCENVLVDDDAYYYLAIARRLAAEGRASFDGIHVTNGVQLAWTGVLAVLARAVPGDIALARSALASGVALNVVIGLLFARVGRQIHSRTCGSLSVVLWSGAMIAHVPTLTAMEYSLNLAVLLAALHLALPLWRRPAKLDRRRWMLGLALVALIPWTRLDAAPFALVLWGVMARAVHHSGRNGERRGRLAWLFLVPLGAALLYVAASHALGGTWMPISGLVKSLYATRHFESQDLLLSLVAHLWWWVSIPLRSALALVYPWALAAPMPRDWLALLAAAALTSLLLAVLFLLLRRGSATGRRAARVLLTLAACGLLHAAILIVVLGHFAHVTAHYFGLLTIVATISAGATAAVLGLGDKKHRLALLVLLAAWLGFDLWRVAKPDDTNLRVRRLALARWIDQNLPASARIGAWNAGQLGYFSHRSVVNLDGLVNDREYLQFLVSRRPLLEYLQRERIPYLADYDAPDLSMPFRFSWNHRLSFRGALRWSEVELLRADTSASPPLFLVQLRSATNTSDP